MSTIDWFYAIATVLAHTIVLVILIWCETSFILRWLSTAMIAHIFADYVLMTQMSQITYFWLYYAFEIVGFFLFLRAYFECKENIRKSEIGIVMLVYLIPEAIHIGSFITHNFELACKFADVLRPIYLGCIIYMCSILIRRKGNIYVEESN